MSRHSGLTVLALALAPIACSALLIAVAGSPMAGAYAGALMIAAKLSWIWALGVVAGVFLEHALAVLTVTAILTGLTHLAVPAFDGTGMTGTWLLVVARWNVMLVAAGLAGLVRTALRTRLGPPMIRGTVKPEREGV